MQFRASQIYISAETRRNLRMIARGEGADKTADEVGDRLLSETIAQRYPALVIFQKQIDAIEKQMIEEVQNAAKI